MIRGEEFTKRSLGSKIVHENARACGLPGGNKIDIGFFVSLEEKAIVNSRQVLPIKDNRSLEDIVFT
jgi:hypothetical protein